MRVSDMIVSHDTTAVAAGSGSTTLHSQGARQKNLLIDWWRDALAVSEPG